MKGNIIAIGLIITGVVLIVLGLILGFSGLRKFATGPVGEPRFPARFLFAMVIDFLGGVSLIIGIILLILDKVA